MRRQTLLARALACVLAVPVVGISSTASAGPCQVGVSRAPDEVRAAIAQWVNAEKRCATSLEVRVVATEGGYYVIAHSGNGGVFERVVPDAQAVGVLVASWAADDGAASSAPVGPAPATGEAPPIAPASSVDPWSQARVEPALRPPGSVAPIALATTATAKDGLPTPPSKQEKRWLAVGGMLQLPIEDSGNAGSESQALRADLDIYRHGKWTIGAGLALMKATMFLEVTSPDYVYGQVGTDEVRAIGTVAYTHRMGKWAVRASGSLGVIYTAGSGYFGSMSVEASGASPTAEAAAVVSRDLSSSWGVLAGPVLTSYQQDYVFMAPGTGSVSYSRGGELSIYAAIVKRL